MPSAPRPDAGHLEDVGVLVGRRADDLAGAGDQLHPGELGGQPGRDPAGAVGAGRGGPGQRLLGDVAHVVQRQSRPLEREVEVLERRAGARRHGHRLAVDRQDAVEPVGEQQRVLGGGDAGEAVPGPGHLHGGAGLPRASDGVDDVVDGSRRLG